MIFTRDGRERSVALNLRFRFLFRFWLTRSFGETISFLLFVFLILGSGRESVLRQSFRYNIVDWKCACVNFRLRLVQRCKGESHRSDLKIKTFYFYLFRSCITHLFHSERENLFLQKSVVHLLLKIMVTVVGYTLTLK